jgi:serine/threonine protein kinase
MIKDPLIGQQLGNYRIENPLGRGGMAQVYYAWDLSLERPVALKVIDARYRHSPAYASRFVREARAVATWRHENIVQIYYADEQDELYYFAMEYIEGLDLGGLMRQYTDAGETMPHDDVLRIGRAIAGALDYAHQKGVIHRDVKPSNVMLSQDARIVLTDFGLALDIQQGSVGEVLGSPHYVAPEQARHSADAVPQSDLYSLGVILYEMLTGTVPFDDPSATSVALQHVTMPPPPPREVNPELNAETEAVLLQALNKSPQERYATGQALLDALETSLHTAPAPPSPELPPLPAAVQPSARRMSQISASDKIASHLRTQATPTGSAPSLPSGADLIGLELDEYRLEALLGHGGMARVYRGVDVRLDRYVAIKVIDTPFRADADYLARFEREAQAIARLEHPHIVRLYRYGEDKGLLYMAMQYVDGADLGAILQSYRADDDFIEPEDAERLVCEICQALDYAHAQGIIHRDVKPANVMLNKQGQAILTDFGLALLTEAGTRGLIFGSPHYIAPEQAISSANVVPQSDLYAVGVILYEMFTGQLPFEADDPLDVAMLHMTETPRPPRKVRPELDAAIEAVILKAMAQEPQDRYTSGAALSTALTEALHKAPSPNVTPQRTIPQRVATEMATPAQSPAPVTFRPAPTTLPEGTQPSPAMVAPAPAAPPSPRHNKQLVLFGGLGLLLCALVALTLTVGAKLFWGATEGTATQLAAIPKAATLTLTAAPAATTTAVRSPALSTTVSPTADVSMATSTPEPSPTVILPTQATPAATEISVATATPSPTAQPAPPQPAFYDLLIVKQGEEGIWIINQTDAPFQLAKLHLVNDKTSIEGSIWSIDQLQPNDCTTAWKDKGDPKLPDGITCNIVGEPVTFSKKDVFWNGEFQVSYDGELVGRCDKEMTQCLVHVPTRAHYTLLIAKRDKDSLFVANLTAQAFPLDQLYLQSTNGELAGGTWGLAQLESGACVAIWNKDKAKAPEDLPCDEPAGQQLMDEDKQPLWDAALDIYYQQELVFTCDEKQSVCIVNMLIP